MFENAEQIISLRQQEIREEFGKEKSEEDAEPLPMEEPGKLPDTNIDDEEFNEDLNLEDDLDDGLFDEEDDYNN